MIKSLEDISQILATVGISSSQEEQILTTIKNLSTYPKVIEESKIHGSHLQDDLEASTHSPFQEIEEMTDLCTASDGEKPIEPEIEELSTCLLVALICIPEINY